MKTDWTNFDRRRGHRRYEFMWTFTFGQLARAWQWIDERVFRGTAPYFKKGRFRRK